VAPIVPTVTNLNKIDIVLLAMAQVDASNFKADGIVLNPLDWTDILLTKDAGGNCMTDPFKADLLARLWQLPVVTTQAMTVDKFLVCAGKRGAQVFDRQDPTVEISDSHSDFFTKNLLAVRAEERLSLAVYRPLAFVKGDFSTELGI